MTVLLRPLEVMIIALTDSYSQVLQRNFLPNCIRWNRTRYQEFQGSNFQKGKEGEAAIRYVEPIFEKKFIQLDLTPKEEERPMKKSRPAPAASSWNLTEVSAWLSANGFSDLVPSFIDQDIDGEALLSMNDADLSQLGLKVGPKARLRNQIAILKEN